jgi:hypothetical protein
MPDEKPQWEDEEETIVSFAPVPPPPAGEALPAAPGATEDEIETIVAPASARGEDPGDRTVVAGDRPVVEQVEALAWLVITQTPSVRRGQMFSLDKPRNDMGRGAGVPVFINDKRVGHVHATVKYELAADGTAHFVLWDLASTNGTFVNGQRVVSPTVLKDGDRIRVGDTELAFKRV